MQTSPSRQQRSMPAQTLRLEDRMTGSNPVSPSSSGSPASSGGMSPLHLGHLMNDSLDGSSGFDTPRLQTRALAVSGSNQWDSPQQQASKEPKLDKNQTDILEQAKHEAKIENRIAELKKEGFWSTRRLSKVPEPTRPKVHWDYLCEEMQWLAADFAQERRWKRGVARKVVRMVIRHHEDLKQKEEKARRDEQAKLRRIAASVAKEVRQFWTNVEKVVQFKQQSRLEEKRKKTLDLQLDFIVGQTEKYSDLLTQSLNETLAPSKTCSSLTDSQTASTASSPLHSAGGPEDEDGDFQPQEEEDDEETIEVEEQQDGNDLETQRREIEQLKRESELPLEELLQTLPQQILASSSSDEDEEEADDDEEEDDDEDEEEPFKAFQPHEKRSLPIPRKEISNQEDEDEEFTANEEEAEDEEETIDAEEALEVEDDHVTELDQLAREGEMPIAELLQQYSSEVPKDKSESSSGSTTSETEQSEDDDEDESSQTDSTEEEEDEESETDEEEEEEEEENENEDEDIGVEYLLRGGEDHEGGRTINDSANTETLGPKKEITDIAATAESLQPTGYTLATAQVKTPVPFLLRGTLREYQHIGLDWLVTMYEKKLNGILADEMGLGKTIQTISLLAHLAIEKGNWGPHLIIVPTSVMLNWEMEIKRWCPSFKILTYYGSQKERKLKRQGWTKPNAFHVCITSYKLVLQDHQAFRRKNWKYLILDEAQNIKNFKSQRWQSLLRFNSQRRLLLTGTPLQNSLMELWSLMHFLMPHVFQSHREFKEWFSNPLTGMIEGSQEYNEGLIKRLHKVLRPFLLRRVKVDVEKQMPKKYEHVIHCRLSKRQRYLYDDFMAQAATRETLASGHFMSVINILMQLRKVCNHPNLFDPRPIHSPFITEGICFTTASVVLRALERDPFKHIDLDIFDLINLEGRVSRYEADTFLPKRKASRVLIEEIADSPDPPPRPKPVKMKVNRMFQPVPKPEGRTVVMVNSPRSPAPPQRPAAPMEIPEPAAPVIPVVPVPPAVQVPPVPDTPQVPLAALPSQVPLPAPAPIPAQSPALVQPPPAFVPALGMNNTSAATTTVTSLLGPVSTPQVLPTTHLPTTPILNNAPRAPVPPISAPVTTSGMRVSPVPPTTVRMPTTTLSPATIGGLVKPMTVQTTATLPGYTFTAAGAMQQRVLLSPDMQARLPSGEVISIAQLASLASRPIQNMQGTKPITFQIHGNRLTLSGPHLRQVAMGQPRQLQGNVVHLVSAGGQHHIISQPAHMALIQAMTQQQQQQQAQLQLQQSGQAQVGVQTMSLQAMPTAHQSAILSSSAANASATAASAGISVPFSAAQASMVNSSGMVKIVVRQAPRDGITSPGIHVPQRQAGIPTPGIPTLITPMQRGTIPGAPLGPTAVRFPSPLPMPGRAPNPQNAPGRPMLRVLHTPVPTMEQAAAVIPPGSVPQASVAGQSFASIPASSPASMLGTRLLTPVSSPATAVASQPMMTLSSPALPHSLIAFSSATTLATQPMTTNPAMVQVPTCSLVSTLASRPLMTATLLPSTLVSATSSGQSPSPLPHSNPASTLTSNSAPSLALRITAANSALTSALWPLTSTAPVFVSSQFPSTVPMLAPALTSGTAPLLASTLVSSSAYLQAPVPCCSPASQLAPIATSCSLPMLACNPASGTASTLAYSPAHMLPSTMGYSPAPMLAPTGSSSAYLQAVTPASSPATLLTPIQTTSSAANQTPSSFSVQASLLAPLRGPVLAPLHSSVQTTNPALLQTPVAASSPGPILSSTVASISTNPMTPVSASSFGYLQAPLPICSPATLLTPILASSPTPKLATIPASSPAPMLATLVSSNLAPLLASSVASSHPSLLAPVVTCSCAPLPAAVPTFSPASVVASTPAPLLSPVPASSPAPMQVPNPSSSPAPMMTPVLATNPGPMFSPRTFTLVSNPATCMSLTVNCPAPTLAPISAFTPAPMLSNQALVTASSPMQTAAPQHLAPFSSPSSTPTPARTSTLLPVQTCSPPVLTGRPLIQGISIAPTLLTKPGAAASPISNTVSVPSYGMQLVCSAPDQPARPAMTSVQMPSHGTVHSPVPASGYGMHLACSASTLAFTPATAPSPAALLPSAPVHTVAPIVAPNPASALPFGHLSSPPGPAPTQLPRPPTSTPVSVKNFAPRTLSSPATTLAPRSLPVSSPVTTVTPKPLSISSPFTISTALPVTVSSSLTTSIARPMTPGSIPLPASAGRPPTPVSSYLATSANRPTTPVSSSAATSSGRPPTPVSNYVPASVGRPPTPVSSYLTSLTNRPLTPVSSPLTTSAARPPTPISSTLIGRPLTPVSNSHTTLAGRPLTPVSGPLTNLVARPLTPVSNPVTLAHRPVTPVFGPLVTAAGRSPTPVSSTTLTLSPRSQTTTSSMSFKEELDTLTLRSTTSTPPPSTSFVMPRARRQPPPPPRSPFYLESLEDKRKRQKQERLDRLFRINERHCTRTPIYGTEILRLCSLSSSAASERRDGWWGIGYAHCYAAQVLRESSRLDAYWQRTQALTQAILTPQQRMEQLELLIDRFIFVMPPVEAPAISVHTSHPPPSLMVQQAMFKETLRQELGPRSRCLHRVICNMRTQFPDLRLIQYDCGKLQTLDRLLRQLKAGSHRVLIFTQMTRMLDVLEQFLNYHGHIYLRLDGSTRVEQRQSLMDRFNADKRIFCFILSTRSGGVGVNLTGADTVVFYDSDWNPTMDAQAQDRCHRIGQTRDVHIYRLISERTVEENILKKANQKRMLGDMAIEGGNFTTAYFKQQTLRDLFEMPTDEGAKKEADGPSKSSQQEEEDGTPTKQNQILEQALCKAEDEEDIRAATQAKAEQVAELAEFNENIPLDADDGLGREEEEEMSKAEQEIASLVEQLTPIERYAMNFLESSLEDISKEELKQAEEQVEAARKDLDQAKDEVFILPGDEEDGWMNEENHSRRSKKSKAFNRPERPGTRVSERLRGTRVESEEPAPCIPTDHLQTRQEAKRLSMGLQERVLPLREPPVKQEVKQTAPVGRKLHRATQNATPTVPESKGLPHRQEFERLLPRGRQGTERGAVSRELPGRITDDKHSRLSPGERSYTFPQRTLAKEQVPRESLNSRTIESGQLGNEREIVTTVPLVQASRSPPEVHLVVEEGTLHSRTSEEMQLPPRPPRASEPCRVETCEDLLHDAGAAVSLQPNAVEEAQGVRFSSAEAQFETRDPNGLSLGPSLSEEVCGAASAAEEVQPCLPLIRNEVLAPPSEAAATHLLSAQRSEMAARVPDPVANARWDSPLSRDATGIPDRAETPTLLSHTQICLSKASSAGETKAQTELHNHLLWKESTKERFNSDSEQAAEEQGTLLNRANWGVCDVRAQTESTRHRRKSHSHKQETLAKQITGRLLSSLDNQATSESHKEPVGNISTSPGDSDARQLGVQSQPTVLSEAGLRGMDMEGKLPPLSSRQIQSTATDEPVDDCLLEQIPSVNPKTMPLTSDKDLQAGNVHKSAQPIMLEAIIDVSEGNYIVENCQEVRVEGADTLAEMPQSMAEKQSIASLGEEMKTMVTFSALAADALLPGVCQNVMEAELLHQNPDLTQSTVTAVEKSRLPAHDTNTLSETNQPELVVTCLEEVKTKSKWQRRNPQLHNKVMNKESIGHLPLDEVVLSKIELDHLPLDETVLNKESLGHLPLDETVLNKESLGHLPLYEVLNKESLGHLPLVETVLNKESLGHLPLDEVLSKESLGQLPLDEVVEGKGSIGHLPLDEVVQGEESIGHLPLDEEAPGKASTSHLPLDEEIQGKGSIGHLPLDEKVQGKGSIGHLPLDEEVQGKGSIGHLPLGEAVQGKGSIGHLSLGEVQGKGIIGHLTLGEVEWKENIRHLPLNEEIQVKEGIGHLPLDEEVPRVASIQHPPLESSKPYIVDQEGAEVMSEKLKESPPRTPRRRTYADGEIRQSQKDEDSPTAKVLRKLPGRIVTIVEDRVLVKRKRKPYRFRNSSNTANMTSPGESSANSTSDAETSATSNLPSNRRIRLETRDTMEESTASSISNLQQKRSETDRQSSSFTCGDEDLPENLQRTVSTTETEWKLQSPDSSNRLPTRQKPEQASDVLTGIELSQHSSVTQRLCARDEAEVVSSSVMDTRLELTIPIPPPVAKRKRGRPPKVKPDASPGHRLSDLASPGHRCLEPVLLVYKSAEMPSPGYRTPQPTLPETTCPVYKSSLQNPTQEKTQVCSMSPSPHAVESLNSAKPRGRKPSCSPKDSKKSAGVGKEKSNIQEDKARKETSPTKGTIDQANKVSMGQSESALPVEKRKRGRPPKVREPKIDPSQLSSSCTPVLKSEKSVLPFHSPSNKVLTLSVADAALPAKIFSNSSSTPPRVLTDASSTPTRISADTTSSSSPRVSTDVSSSSPKVVTDTSCTPPKRKRGRPPKIQSTPKIEKCPRPSASERESSLDEAKNLKPPSKKATRKKRKLRAEEAQRGTRLSHTAASEKVMGQSHLSDSETSSEESPPLTRLAKIKMESQGPKDGKEMESGSEVSARIAQLSLASAARTDSDSEMSKLPTSKPSTEFSDKAVGCPFSPRAKNETQLFRRVDDTSSQESSASEIRSPRSEDIPRGRCTRQTPSGNLMPALESDKQITKRRKRQSSSESSARQSRARTDSEADSTSEDDGSRTHKRPRGESDRQKKTQLHSAASESMADRILRSVAAAAAVAAMSPASNTRSSSVTSPTPSAPSPTTVRKTGPIAITTLSNRGRKPKT